MRQLHNNNDECFLEQEDFLASQEQDRIYTLLEMMVLNKLQILLLCLQILHSPSTFLLPLSNPMPTLLKLLQSLLQLLQSRLQPLQSQIKLLPILEFLLVQQQNVDALNAISEAGNSQEVIVMFAVTVFVLRITESYARLVMEIN